MMRAVRPLLHVVSAALLLLGAAAEPLAKRLWVPDGAARGGDRSPTGAPTPAALPSLAASASAAPAALASNLFSPLRTVPAARFTDTVAVSRPASPPSPRHHVRLFGTGTTGGRATALLDADPRIPGAEIYHAGDLLPGGGRVVRIASDHVVIDGPEGRERLRLQPASARPPLPTPPEGS